MSTLADGMQSNVGLIYQLLKQHNPATRRTLYYEKGLQFEGWSRIGDLASGRGINRQIRRAYGYLASHYREGDRIYLFGYSRGAFAVRSLAGLIDRVGLLRREHATERAVQLAYRHYATDPDRPAAGAFSRRFCHAEAQIDGVFVFDTVKALGLRIPLLWMLTDPRNAFHNHNLGFTIKRGFQALALDETRVLFAPVLWECEQGCNHDVEQMWFRGAHGDIGGQIGTVEGARKLSNIPLVWMLERAQACGLDLPPGWQGRFECDPDAPMVGTWSSWGKLFLYRRRRVMLRDPSERIHASVGVKHRAWRHSDMPPPAPRVAG